MADKEIQHRVGEQVVAVAGDHVPRAVDVDELDVREAGQKLVGALLADQVAHLTAHQQHGNSAGQDRFHRRVHPIDIGQLVGRKGCRLADELRIPVPVPAVAAAAQVGAQAVEIGRPWPMRVVFGDHVGDFVE